MPTLQQVDDRGQQEHEQHIRAGHDEAAPWTLAAQDSSQQRPGDLRPGRGAAAPDRCWNCVLDSRLCKACPNSWNRVEAWLWLSSWWPPSGRLSTSATRGSWRVPSPRCLPLRSVKWADPANLPALRSGRGIRGRAGDF